MFQCVNVLLELEDAWYLSVQCKSLSEGDVTVMWYVFLSVCSVCV